MVSPTLLTLFILPLLYPFFETKVPEPATPVAPAV